MIKIKDALKSSALFWPDFIEVDGGVFLKHEAPESPDTDDLIQTEAFINHIHILDCFSHKAFLTEEPWWNSDHADFKSACELGKKIASMWKMKLQADFPESDFLIYYTEEDNPIIRFHKIRTGTENWLNPELCKDQIKSGKIIILETNK